jgi:hypothetical protein
MRDLKAVVRMAAGGRAGHLEVIAGALALGHGEEALLVARVRRVRNQLTQEHILRAAPPLKTQDDYTEPG